MRSLISTKKISNRLIFHFQSATFNQQPSTSQPWPLATLREQPSTSQPWPLATLREQPSTSQPSTFNLGLWPRYANNLQPPNLPTD
ncbi:MAG: hypothetical protein F6K50_49980 [Moorea sp. SIO3I7]|uniref:hypothetical protein n=1 Tax=Moorena sp. SIO3I8 TaxID=2607833 RepID=UPI0013BEEFF3|nr:hypothetical protein [Moorena sp. SIO3I8]NEO03163.1 hypothetical protein [Moorena sp. SIO3I7]NEO06656.1 hypothetical protein [Moorena sp. SIO3I8]